MKYLLLLLLLPQITFADTITECGEYTAKGVVRAKKGGLALIVNEKTLSEYIITMSIHEQAQISSLIDKDATVQLVLDRKFNGQTGPTSKILSAKSRIPDPLNPEDTGFKLNKKLDCKKE